MKRILSILLVVPFTSNMQAAVHTNRVDTTNIVQTFLGDDALRPITPTYIKGALVSSPWTDNWFVQMSGGATAFLGSPLGCNDLFGRMKPAVSVAIGKWFTPSVGGRIEYGGMQFKDCNAIVQDYQYMRADFLYNVLGNVQTADHTSSRWSVMPFAGVGMLNNKSNAHKPFAISFGVQGQFRLSNRISVMAELGDMSTMQDFDGYGDCHKFGDHLLSLKAGLSVNIGKVGWKRAVDAHPYIVQNDWLMEYATSLSDTNERYRSQQESDAKALEQLRKILEIEGLLDKYNNLFNNSADNKWKRNYPKNDYSGLNSLRARMRNRGKNSDCSVPADSADYADLNGSSRDVISDSTYIAMIQSGKRCIGAPVYFFFKLGTVNLTDASQKLNLDELARVAKKYGLSIRVTGAADSATGSTDINDALSESRADFIVNELINRGVAEKSIHRNSNGGIDDFAPNEANRHTKVALFFKH